MKLIDEVAALSSVEALEALCTPIHDGRRAAITQNLNALREMLKVAPQPLTDEQCDKAAAQAMDRVAAARRLHALDLNPDITAHHTLRREMIRTGYALADGGRQA